jgi:hypothetical protein
MRRRLRLRRRARTVVWGARRGDRVVGSSRDLLLARRERELAELDRRLMAAAAKRLRAVRAVSVSATEVAKRLRLMGDALDRASRPVSLELERARRRMAR